jgi:antitoxin component YwqK of YwqJK toxin-antitoxin module
MKKYLLYLFVLIISSSFAVISFTQIVSAVKSGNATEVSKYFDNSVEITLPDKSNSYSKSQAQLVLQEFFKNNPVKDFKIIHQSENTGSEYCIGNLTTTNGVFRTTIFVKQKGQKDLVQELRFEK